MSFCRWRGRPRLGRIRESESRRRNGLHLGIGPAVTLGQKARPPPELRGSQPLFTRALAPNGSSLLSGFSDATSRANSTSLRFFEGQNLLIQLIKFGDMVGRVATKDQAELFDLTNFLSLEFWKSPTKDPKKRWPQADVLGRDKRCLSLRHQANTHFSEVTA